jgi:hypothetical protein
VADSWFSSFWAPWPRSTPQVSSLSRERQNMGKKSPFFDFFDRKYFRPKMFLGHILALLATFWGYFTQF